MNKMKPEDVMRALECCKSPKLTKCDQCPRKDEDAQCMYRLCNDALALLREKDAKISALQYQADFWDKHAKVLDETIRIQQKEIAEKDAKIERLSVNMNAYGLTAKNLAKDFADYQADVKMEIADARAGAITEFEERLIKYYDALKSGLVAYHIREVAKELKEASNA